MKKVPTKVKAIRGTLRRDRDGGAMDIVPVTALPVAPARFKKDQKELWFTICHTLMAVGILQAIGVKTIEIYCEQYGMYQDAVKDIEENGFYTVEVQKYGNVRKKNPAIEAMATSYSIMQNISDRFGFSPLSQSRIKNIGVTHNDSKEEEFSDI